MNTKRLLLAIVVVFVAMFLTDFLIHGVWLQSTYKETAGLWRSEAEMTKHMPFLLIGQLLASVTFCVIWFKGLPSVSTLGSSCLYGLTMALYAQAGMVFINYAVQPMPGSLMVKWFVAGVVQGVVLGALLYLVGKPTPAQGAAAPSAA